MDFPLEIREMIYECAMEDLGDTVRFYESDCKPEPCFPAYLPAIFYTSKVIFEEATAVMLRTKNIQLDYWVEPYYFIVPKYTGEHRFAEFLLYFNGGSLFKSVRSLTFDPFYVLDFEESHGCQNDRPHLWTPLRWIQLSTNLRYLKLTFQPDDFVRCSFTRKCPFLKYQTMDWGTPDQPHYAPYYVQRNLNMVLRRFNLGALFDLTAATHPHLKQVEVSMTTSKSFSDAFDVVREFWRQFDEEWREKRPVWKPIFSIRPDQDPKVLAAGFDRVEELMRKRGLREESD